LVNALAGGGRSPPVAPARAASMSTLGMSIDALERFTTVVNRLFVLIASLLVVGIMLVTVREVFVRYALNQPSLWAMDGSRYALLYAFFLALGPALQSGHHVHVDLFDSIFPARLRRYQAPVGHFLVVVFGAVLFRHVLDVTVEMFETGEMTFSAVPVPLKYVYWIGPVGVAEFCLTALVGFLRACQSIGGGAGTDGQAAGL
jgi:TRAP-type C4-dicarboxylate transport system permease small subunit